MKIKKLISLMASAVLAVTSVSTIAYASEIDSDEGADWDFSINCMLFKEQDNENHLCGYYNYPGERHQLPENIGGSKPFTEVCALALAGYYDNGFKAEVPDSVESIDEMAFLGVGERVLTDITIPAGVTEIGDYAVGYTYTGEFPVDYEYMPYELDGEIQTEYIKKADCVVIHGYKGTAAEVYASENGFAFDSLEPPVTTAPAPAQTALTTTTLCNTNNLLIPLITFDKIKMQIGKKYHLLFKNAVLNDGDEMIVYTIPDSGDGGVYSKPVKMKSTNGNGDFSYIDAFEFDAYSVGKTALYFEDSEGKNCVVRIIVEEVKEPVVTDIPEDCEPVFSGTTTVYGSWSTPAPESSKITTSTTVVTANDLLIPECGTEITMDKGENREVYFKNAVVSSSGCLFRMIVGNGRGAVYPVPYAEKSEDGKAIQYIMLCAYGAGETRVYIEDDEGKSCILNITVIGEEEETKPTPSVTTANVTTSVYTTVQTTIQPTVTAKPEKIIGDLNGDKKVNIADLVYMQRIINKDKAYSDSADMNRDGTVNVFDMVILKRRILGE